MAIVAVIAAVTVACGAASLGVAIWLDSTTPRQDPKTGTGTGTGTRTKGLGGGDWGSVTGGAWKRGMATYYVSYPACCKNSPNYSPTADKTECEDNSGCEYLGQFAGVDGAKSFEWVKQNNIVSLYELGSNEAEWRRRKWAGKHLRLKNPKTGATMEAVVLDTCANSDCDGCCSRNAKKGGGTLIDLEYNTAKRFWAPGPVEGLKEIQWKCLDC
jgi:hypothetical protein